MATAREPAKSWASNVRSSPELICDPAFGLETVLAVFLGGLWGEWVFSAG
jgi:hypothetical protein